MPEKETIERAREDAREGKSPGTQAGEFVREEFHHIREGKHGARSTKQAVAIGLSKARRAGVKLQAPAGGKASADTRKKAAQDLERGESAHSTSPKRSRAVSKALKKEAQRRVAKSALSPGQGCGSAAGTCGSRTLRHESGSNQGQTRPQPGSSESRTDAPGSLSRLSPKMNQNYGVLSSCWKIWHPTGPASTSKPTQLCQRGYSQYPKCWSAPNRHVFLLPGFGRASSPDCRFRGFRRMFAPSHNWQFHSVQLFARLQ